MLEVEELLNVVDPRGSTTSVDQTRRTVTLSLAKWGRPEDFEPWPTLVQVGLSSHHRYTRLALDTVTVPCMVY